MRIACIATSQVPSRTANSIQLMKACASMAGLGHQVQLWVPGRDPEVGWDELAAHYGLQTQVEIRWLRSLRVLRRYDFALRAVLHGRRWGAELFYVWPYQAAALTASLGLPTLMELHDRPAGRTGPTLFRAFLRGSGARRLLVTTEALRQWAEMRFGRALVTPFAQVAPNGVDLELYRALPEPAEARAALGLLEGFTAGYTGHLYPGRGLEIMRQLARRIPEVRFLWVGGEEAAVESWRARLQAERIENIQLLGFVPNQDLPLIQAACEVLLMPYGNRISVSSGGDTAATASPMKVFEYLAAGRAILASDLPILREVLSEQNSALLPPEDLPAWESTLRQMKKYPERRERLATRARRDAQRFSWSERARRAVEGVLDAG